MEFDFVNLAGLLFNKAPWLVSLAMYMGLFRMMIKPITAGIEAYTSWTKDPSDDAKWAKIKKNILPMLMKALDLFTSIKKPSV